MKITFTHILLMIIIGLMVVFNVGNKPTEPKPPVIINRTLNLFNAQDSIKNQHYENNQEIKNFTDSTDNNILFNILKNYYGTNWN